MSDVECNECGDMVDWGREYPDPRGGVSDDMTDALCPDCYHDIPVEERH